MDDELDTCFLATVIRSTTATVDASAVSLMRVMISLVMGSRTRLITWGRMMRKNVCAFV